MKSKNSRIKLNKAGRPSKFKSINMEQLKFLVHKGCTDREICQFFKIGRTTLWRYEQTNAEFRNTLKEWKNQADDRVERSLFESAVGYSHESEVFFCFQGKIIREKTIKRYPPNVIACIFWLKNRKPEVWRENPPPAMDERFQDAELQFIGVPNQKDPKFEARFKKFYDQT